MLNDGWWLNSLTLACEACPELTSELLGSPPDLRLTGLTGNGPMRVIPKLVRAYLPETRSLDLRCACVLVVVSLLARTQSLAISRSEGNDLSGEVPGALFAL